ncbi:PucR family transcriptional regulator [Streptomyces longwoodensis]|uniref:PucR family transcriptional regulator n=1 Tax=Streptomyces longwoodensis TaxID=68231 RepID=UPI00384F82C1
MERETPTAWPVRRRMPDLATLDDSTRAAVVTAVARLRTLRDVFADRCLALLRRYVPGYAVLSDDEIQASARRFMDILTSELSSLRVPDAALRDVLREHAVERAKRGLPHDALAIGYQLGSREMLALMDEVAADVHLPAAFLVAMHDSTWEFSNEASSLFARVQHELVLERSHVEAERRSAFVEGVLSGTLPADRINRDAHLFGLDPRARYVALATRASSSCETDALRRAVASAMRSPSDQLLSAPVRDVLGFITARSPEAVVGQLVCVGPPLPLDQLAAGFDAAVLALHTARQFAMSGVVHLTDLGPRPLVLSSAGIAESLAAKHLTPLDAVGGSSGEVEETVRTYLDCDQQVGKVARRLTVHPNTVRYRVKRFEQLTGLDLRRTEDLVTSWWLLNRRRA